MRTPRPAFVGLIGVLVLSGCAVAAAATLPTPAPPSPQAIAVRNVEISTTFAEPPATAVTYDSQLVPVGSRIAVSAKSEDGTTTVRLALRGLPPNRRYGAHVHADPCGATGAAAGPTYQHVVDPVQPSVDPEYANPDNEIWLDFRTDEAGAGSAQSTVDWGFTADRRAQSVVVHAWPTATEAGRAGSAGTEVGCVTVKF
jgi:superoxide dismutase, Cu-Zn family